MSDAKLIHRFSAAELARHVARGDLSVREVAEATLARIDALDGQLHAWAFVDRQVVLARADELDRARAAGKPSRLLHGVPLGVKDIFDVAGMPTRAGSRVRSDAPPAALDSEPVAAMRAADALIIGKTHTTEFAYAEPAPTRNPWNLECEPGGSSSGSAASVAAAMIPAALGTQTAGSVLRPAAFCGVVGFKPSFGRISRRGVIPFAWSLDTMGTLTRTVEDARLLASVLAGLDPPPEPGADAMERPPRLAYAPRILAERQHPSMSAALASAAAAFEKSGAKVDEVSLPADFDVSLESHHVIMVAEGAAYHAEGLARAGERYGVRLRTLVETGLLVRAADYLRAQRVRRDLYERVAPLFLRCDALLVPAAAGPAPRKTEGHTGDPAFNAPWTLFGLPAITLRGGTDIDGLPLGIQLVGRPRGDEALLDVAAWCERVRGPSPAPPAPFA